MLKDIIIYIILGLLISPPAFSNESAEIFASNNSSFIDINQAYNRLAGCEQKELQHAIVHILQTHHIEQGWLDDTLGIYTSYFNQQSTADNTAIFILSPYQDLSEKNILVLAQDLAISLHQESIAVFIPGGSTTGAIHIKFTASKPTIDELTAFIHNTLPTTYSQAYSIWLYDKHSNLAQSTVSEIEWLGSDLNVNEIIKAFPNEEVAIKPGRALLIYADGTCKAL